MKIAVITCYHDPDYIRARTLRAGLKLVPGVRVIVIKNKHKGLLRYPEVIWKTWKARKNDKPDAYLLTFRGQEILPLILLLAGKKPVFFDEFIVPISYATGENHQKSFGIRLKYFLARLSEPMYRSWLKRCRVILSDTLAHGELSARSSRMNMRKYLPVPVGADETLFKPGARSVGDKFQVFYYSSDMQPLHGFDTVLEAATLLHGQENIEFLISGGKRHLKSAVAAANKLGANIRYESWIDFDKLPATMLASGVCLGGPFGDTPQANSVITGKTYQSLACSVPTIVGSSYATDEFFVNKQNALVVPQADAPALAKAITWAAKNPKELQQIGGNGRKLYDKSFSNAAIAQKLRRLSEVIS
ncbi:MAG: glycosyltransferase [Candidatus Saccharimonadales bacterium]